jgi:hypothetical protein
LSLSSDALISVNLSNQSIQYLSLGSSWGDSCLFGSGPPKSEENISGLSGRALIMGCTCLMSISAILVMPSLLFAMFLATHF